VFNLIFERNIPKQVILDCMREHAHNEERLTSVRDNIYMKFYNFVNDDTYNLFNIESRGDLDRTKYGNIVDIFNLIYYIDYDIFPQYYNIFIRRMERKKHELQQRLQHD
jgi:hypothetical protein